MLTLIIQTFWLFLPAGIANMMPVLFRWMPFLDYPVDFNKKFMGKPLFGSHKTFRGFAVGILASIVIVYLQRLAYPYMIPYSLVDYSAVNIYLLGFLLGFGALAGDCVESFFKRRFSIKPGQSWIPFDQIDWTIGSVIFIYFYIPLSWKHIITAIILFGLLHLLIDVFAYLFKFKKWPGS